jgi:D-glycero-D-manno-heptose 1,7-bisphosphate phosphatase
MRRAIFLDRDGVLNAAVLKNGKPYPPSNLNELQIPADVPGAIASLKAAGFLLLGATNQPDVARGTTSRTTVEAINTHLMQSLSLDEIRVCYHDDADRCFCRKPLPGLLLEAAKTFAVDLTESFMIGDRWKDIEAGDRAGCKTIWINRNYNEKRPEKTPHFEAKNLSEAAAWILQSM